MDTNINPIMPFDGEIQAPELPLPMAESEPATDGNGADSWHVEAGRKGARRVHELMQLGLLYEKEHGLKRGRQRLRQLIEEGRLYEQEHGIRAKPRHAHRTGGDQVVQNFVRSLLRMVKPAYRARLERLLEKV